MNRGIPRRWLAVATLVCFVVGCSAPNLPDPAETQKKVNQEKLRKGKLLYAAFLDEAIRGADILASQPEANQLEAEIKKLNELLAQAADVYPENATLNEAGKRCRGIVRYFTASLTTIKHNFTGKTDVPVKTKEGVYKACASNESAARKSVEIARRDLGLAPSADDEK